MQERNLPANEETAAAILSVDPSLGNAGGDEGLQGLLHSLRARAEFLPLKATPRVSGATGPGARLSMSRTMQMRSISSFGQAGCRER